MNLTDLLTVANLVFLVCTIIGGWLVIRSTIAKSEVDVQTRVREALSAENVLLQERIERMEKENKRLQQVINTIRHALKRRGLLIEVEGEYVTLTDIAGQNMPAQGSQTNIAKVQPIKLQPIGDDDTA